MGYIVTHPNKIIAITCVAPGAVAAVAAGYRSQHSPLQFLNAGDLEFQGGVWIPSQIHLSVGTAFTTNDGVHVELKRLRRAAADGAGTATTIMASVAKVGAGSFTGKEYDTAAANGIFDLSSKITATERAVTFTRGDELIMITSSLTGTSGGQMAATLILVPAVGRDLVGVAP